MLKDAGALKVIFDRTRGYFQIFAQLMVFYLFLKEAGWYWWYLGIVFFFIFWMIYDIKNLVGKERDFIWTRSGVMNDMVKNVEYIKRKLDFSE